MIQMYQKALRVLLTGCTITVATIKGGVFTSHQAKRVVEKQFDSIRGLWLAVHGRTSICTQKTPTLM